MPPAIIAGVAAGIGAGITGGLAIGVTVGVITAGLQAASSLLQPKPPSPSFADFGARAARSVELRLGTDEPVQAIYGERQVSGTMTYGGNSGPGNALAHFIVDLAGHEVAEIGTVLLKEYHVDAEHIDPVTGVVDQSLPFSGSQPVLIRKHLGADDQAADSQLVGAVSEWTAAHQGKGIAYLHVRIDTRSADMPSIPNIRAVVKGRKVADWRDTPVTVISSSVANPTLITCSSAHGLSVGDRVFLWGHAGAVPRVHGEHQVLSTPTSTTLTIGLDVTTAGAGGQLLQMRWTDNAALCIADYLATDFAPGGDPARQLERIDELDIAAVQAAANICDEPVGLSADTPTFTFAADATQDWLTQATPPAGERYRPLHTGDGVELATTDTLPGGLAIETTYYAIVVSDGDTSPHFGQTWSVMRFRLATTLDNARRGVFIDITSAGTGTHTLTRKTQPRYTVNYAFLTDERPIDVVEAMVQAMGGAGVFTQGVDRIFAGAYTGPATETLDESSLRGGPKIAPRPRKQALFNSIHARFVDRDLYWKPNLSETQKSATAIAEDGGEEIETEVELDAVTDNARAQRLTRLQLLRARESVAVDWPANDTALEHAVMDTVNLDLDLAGWAGKEFEIAGWTGHSPGGIDLSLRETHPDLYAWDPDTDEIVTDLAPNTTLADRFDVPAPTSLDVSTEVIVGPELDESLRFRLAWTYPDTRQQPQLSKFEIQFKKETAGAFEPWPPVPGTEREASIGPIFSALTYRVRIRAVNNWGHPSNWFPDDAGLEVDADEPPAADDWGIVSEGEDTASGEDWGIVSEGLGDVEDWGRITS